MFPIRNTSKQGDGPSPFLFNFVLEQSIRRFQVNRIGLKLNGIYQFLVYADDVNILGGSVQTVKKNVETLLVACKEIGLEVNGDKTKYMVMSGDQNAGRRLIIGNRAYEIVEQFKYLGKTLTNLKSIQEEIKSRL
jgi:hypothetical protein